MHRRLASYTLLLSLHLLLSACGFQLRGVGDNATTLPDDWKSMHLVTGNPNGEFSREVEPVLPPGHPMDTQGRCQLPTGPGARALQPTQPVAQCRGPGGGIRTDHDAHFSVLDADNQVIIATTEVAVVRQMENDPRNVVGKAEETRIIKSEMRGDLARQIMRRIGFFASSNG